MNLFNVLIVLDSIMTIESLAVQRPTFSYDNFDQYYESKKKDRSIRTKFRQWRHNFHCNSRR